MTEYARLTQQFARLDDVTEWENWIKNLDIDSTSSNDPFEASQIISQRKSLLQIHELNLDCQSFKAQSQGQVEMGERLEYLSRQHRDVIQRISVDDDVMRRRIELWNQFKHDQQRLKEWIKEMESEKMILNLRHLQLENISETITAVQVITFKSTKPTKLVNKD